MRPKTKDTKSPSVGRTAQMSGKQMAIGQHGAKSTEMGGTGSGGRALHEVPGAAEGRDGVSVSRSGAVSGAAQGIAGGLGLHIGSSRRIALSDGSRITFASL